MACGCWSVLKKEVEWFDGDCICHLLCTMPYRHFDDVAELAAAVNGEQLTLVVLAGLPGCGKSSFFVSCAVC